MSAIARRLLRGAAGAVAFLTRLPLGARLDLDAGDVARGTVLFPLVGAGIGAAVAGVTVGLDHVLTPFLAAGIGVAMEAGLTGAIHLDALADFADSLGARSREQALEVMRDPRVGAFGAVSVVLDMLLKTGAVAALLAEDGLLAAVVAAFTLGRAAPLVLAWFLPYARPGTGSGRALTDGPRAWERAAGLLLAVGIAVWLTGPRTLVLAGAGAVAILLVGGVAWRRLGGVTGDVLGAGIELATTGALLGAAATI